MYWENGKWILKYQYDTYYYSTSTSNDPLPPTTGWKRNNGSTDGNFVLEYGPVFYVSPTSVTVNETAGTVAVRIRMERSFPFLTTVDYATHNGSAKSGSDFSGVSGTMAFNGGDSSATINIPITNDTV